MGSDHTSLCFPRSFRTEGEIHRRVCTFMLNGEWNSSCHFNFRVPAALRTFSSFASAAPTLIFEVWTPVGSFSRPYPQVSLGGGSHCGASGTAGAWGGVMMGSWVSASPSLSSSPTSPVSKLCPWHQWSGPAALDQFFLSKLRSFSSQSLRDSARHHRVSVS